MNEARLYEKWSVEKETVHLVSLNSNCTVITRKVWDGSSDLSMYDVQANKYPTISKESFDPSDYIN